VTVTGLAVLFLPMNLDRPLFGPSAVPRRYTVRLLDPSGVLDPLALKVNDRGQVLGWFRNPQCSHQFESPFVQDSHFHSFLTRPNRPINPETDDLNAIAGAMFRANGVNNLGQVVGFLIDSPDGNEYGQTRGVLVDGGRVLEVGTLPDAHFLVRDDELRNAAPRPQRVQALDINDRGQIAGIGARLNGEIRSFLTGPGQPINASTLDLEPYDGTRDYGELSPQGRRLIEYSIPFWLPRGDLAVNNLGQVTGKYFDARPLRFADRRQIRTFRTAPGRPIDPETDDLGSLARTGRTFTVTHDINIHGQVVGNSGGHGFRTGANRAINPETDALAFLPAAINDAGWVVGGPSLQGRDRPAVLDDGMGTYILNDLIDPASGWTIVSANDINNWGQIIGQGSRGDGREQSLLLDPVPDYGPLSWLLAGTALTGLGQWASRWKGSKERAECPGPIPDGRTGQAQKGGMPHPDRSLVSASDVPC
jgi:hypothetical protein